MVKLRRRRLGGGWSLPTLCTFDEARWIEFHGQEVQISESSLQWRRGAIFGLCQDGLVSAVSARVSGYAEVEQPIVPRRMLIEVMKELSDDMVVLLHIRIGTISRAYETLGYVQFATHEGLCRALPREAAINNQIIVVDTTDMEFMLERFMELPRGIREPQCVTDGKVKGKVASVEADRMGGSCQGDEDSGEDSDFYEVGMQAMKLVEEQHLEMEAGKKGGQRRGGSLKDKIVEETEMDEEEMIWRRIAIKSGLGRGGPSELRKKTTGVWWKAGKNPRKGGEENMVDG